MDTNVGNGYSSVGRRAHASGPGGSTGGISRVAAISLSSIYVLGAVTMLFAPETKGKALPEELSSP